MKRIFFTVLAMLFGYFAGAQTSGPVHLADSLHMSYDFTKARDLYTEILANTDPVTDSVLYVDISERILRAENGKNMSRFVQKPTVAAKKKFSIEDFFLYYPLEDKSWRPVPNMLDTLPERSYVHGLYAREWDDKVYYSAMGESGNRDIMMIQMLDTAWTAPVVDTLLSTHAADEIFPLLSNDGKTMYFSSKGLYGIGGYDIYASQWDEKREEWSTPQNLGLPYSSPADDFLYMETPDGEYTMFASNRECGKDSVVVYVLYKETYPVHAPVGDPEELRTLARLDVPEREIVEDAAEEKQVEIPDNELTVMYGQKMSEVKLLRDSIASSMDDLEEMRNEYILSNDPGERIRLTNRILELETRLPSVQRSLEQASRELRDIEMEFLREGIFLNMDVSESSAEDENETLDFPEYEFQKMRMGPELYVWFQTPEVEETETEEVIEEIE